LNDDHDHRNARIRGYGVHGLRDDLRNLVDDNGGIEVMMSRKWSHRRIKALLRFARKNEGPWDDIDMFYDGVDKYEDDELPEEGDATLLAAAPELLEAVERLLIGAAACAIPHPKEREVLQMAVDFAIQAKRKAKGGE